MGAIVANLLNAIDALSLAGARYVVVPNLPALGLTPEGRASSLELPTILSMAFNARLESAPVAYALNAIRLDVLRLTQQVVCAGITSTRPRRVTRCSRTLALGLRASDDAMPRAKYCHPDARVPFRHGPRRPR
jgi:outer membrane lipase/esterase